jgi:hypothetical protein
MGKRIVVRIKTARNIVPARATFIVGKQNEKQRIG